MGHILIRDSSLNGWEYGMLRSFESAIIKDTGATTVDIPSYGIAGKYLHHFGHGMDRASYRRYFPKQEFSLEGDVAWHILMGPENYRLDLYKGWQRKCRTNILYLYDTMPSQIPLIRKLFSDNTWDILITSFNDAVPDLEKATGRKWHCIEQAADGELFQPLSTEERLIHFSSYGRRYPVLHEALKDFCRANGLYYDYTTHDARHPTADAPELYRQYAWHVSHSLFTFSWPVELTNPARAGHLRPITCRWFEAAAAGTVIVGQKPGNPQFDKYFPPEMVVDLDPAGRAEDFINGLERLMKYKDQYTDRARHHAGVLKDTISWNNRVERIRKLCS